MSKSTLILMSILVMASAQLDMLTDQMDFEDNIAEESQSDEQLFVNAITPKPILNDGKPFYVARDPTTGTLDFNVKKTAGIQNDIPVSRKDELSGNSKSGHDINSLGHNNFHDFLNLPVKYSSAKFVYPLISGSYANMKYQGNNKNHVSNHKNYTTTLGTTTTLSPKYFAHITMPARNEFTATFKHPETTEQQIAKTTTHKPTTSIKTSHRTTERTTTKTTTTQRTTTTPLTTQSPTIKYSSTIVQNSFPSTFKNKYVDSSETRKKTTTVETTSTTKAPPRSTTQPSNPIKFLDDLLESVETKATTYRPHFDVTKLTFSTSMPLAPSGFKPMPTESPSKISFEKAPRNPSIMTLSEIINSYNGNDNISNEQNSIQYDTSDSSQIEIKRLPAGPLTQAPVQQTPSPVKPHQTLQQQMQHQSPPKAQFVDLPVHQPGNFAPPSHIGFPQEEFEDYVEFENPQDQYANQFVKYEVPKPNKNLVKFQQVPSMNNVVISPGQNSASFVLGSQQSVGSVGVGSSMGVGSSSFADNNGPMKVGQVMNDDAPIRSSSQPASNQIQASIRFPSDAEHSFDNAPIVKGVIKLDGSSESVQPPQALSQNQPPAKNQLVFPSNENMIRPDTMNAELSIGAPAPTSTNPSQIIFENVNDIYGKINEKKIKQEIASNELSNNIPAGELTPSYVLTPPSPAHQRPFIRQQSPPPHFNMRRPQRPNIPGLPNILPQFRPNAKASQGHPHLYKDVGAIRIPVQDRPMHGPNPYNRQYQPQVPLPKAGLPPMMPNQQNQNPNFRRLQNSPNRPYVTRTHGPSPPQQYQQQYGPNHPQQQHGPNHPQQQNGPNQSQQQQHGPNHPQQKNAPNQPPQYGSQFDPSLESGNRRLFRVPPPPPQMNDRVFMKPPQIAPPGFQLKRNQNGPPETMQMQQRPSNIPQAPSNVPQLQNMQQFPDFELNKSSPPQALHQYAPKPSDNEDEPNGTSLEPVITLQMLQHKKSGSKLNLPPVPHDIPQDIQAPIPSNHKEDPSKKPSIYVVYPVSSNSYENSASFESSINNADPAVVIGSRGESPIHGVSEYQNTPFSVVSHFEQEPLLMKKDKKKNQFPYHLERPAPTSDLRFDRPKYGASHDGFAYNTGEEPTIARVVNKRPPFANEHPDAAISSKLTRVTEKPIAIAYTPTEPNRSYPTVTNFYQNLHPHHHYSHHYDPNLGDKFSMPNYGGPVISEILDEKHIGYDYYHHQQQQQLQQHLNNGEDLNPFKEHYDFQAPFQASVSVNPEVTNPYEGWSIVTQSTDTNKIDRADLNVIDSSEESTTKKFNPTEFQPVFESGFQPIYSERKVSTAPELVADSSELPLTLALTHSTSEYSTSTTPLPSTSSSEASPEYKFSDESTTKTVEKKKPKVEIDSLEAFFESLTRDYDDDESTNKSENESSRSL